MDALKFFKVAYYPVALVVLTELSTPFVNLRWTLAELGDDTNVIVK